MTAQSTMAPKTVLTESKTFYSERISGTGGNQLSMARFAS